MTIKLDNGDKITIYVCDDHAVNATVQAVKDAYTNKQGKIEELMKQAEELGLHVSMTTNGIAPMQEELPPVVSKPTAASNAVQPANAEQMTSQIPEDAGKKVTVIVPGAGPPTDDMLGDDVVSTDIIDSNKGMQSVGGASGGHAVDSHSSIDLGSLEDKLPEEARRGRVKMEMMEGRGGQPIAIPKKRVDGTGTTRINIVNTGGDSALQERFKNAAMSEDSDFRHGYQGATRDCPICKGTGFAENAGEEISCPKCSGTGIIH